MANLTRFVRYVKQYELAFDTYIVGCGIVGSVTGGACALSSTSKDHRLDYKLATSFVGVGGGFIGGCVLGLTGPIAPTFAIATVASHYLSRVEEGSYRGVEIPS